MKSTTESLNFCILVNQITKSITNTIEIIPNDDIFIDTDWLKNLSILFESVIQVLKCVKLMDDKYNFRL